MNNEIKELFEIFKNGKFDEARSKALQLQNKYKKEKFIFQILGMIGSQTGNYAEAIQNFKKALEIDPFSYENLNNLANALEDIQDFEKAIFYYNKALKIKPNHIHIMNNLGSALTNIGKPENAINYFKQVIGIDPKFFQAYNNLGNAQKKLGLLEDAIESYKKSISIKPDYSLAYNNLGVAYMEISNLDDSLLSYNESLKINPNYANAYWNIHPFAPNIEESIKILAKCIKLDKNNVKAKLMITALEFYRGNHKPYNDLKHSSLKDHPYTRSFNWVFSLPSLPHLFFDRWALFDSMAEISDKSRPFYEFGVWRGTSFKYLIGKYGKGFGFDTFEGIPENWYNEPKGSYSSKGNIPNIDGGEFIQGEFENTLPSFFSKDRPMASLINFDADLYSSTLSALSNSMKVIDRKTVLIFDEFILNDDWENDEYKALTDFCSLNSLQYEVLAVSFFTKQSALKLSNI